MKVRLYGHQLGYTSFSQVTRGFVKALAKTEDFGGFVPLDFYEEDTVYPGATCPVSINTGMPSGVLKAFVLGAHERRYLMLAPNSDRIPEGMAEWLPKFVTGLLAPSKWAVEVLENIFRGKLPVHLVPHGVHEEYHRIDSMRRARVSEYVDTGRFTVLHLTSTNSERKGTKLLLEAWQSLMGHPVSAHCRLTIVCRYEGYVELAALVKDLRIESSVQVKASDGRPYEFTNAEYGDAHVLCQPSRAEGFGLCPLEAKAAGLPVIMTACTGHGDHATEGAVRLVETGPSAPIDDMDGALAPSLDSEAILDALWTARRDYVSLETLASVCADQIRDTWSWPNTTGRALKEIL